MNCKQCADWNNNDSMSNYDNLNKQINLPKASLPKGRANVPSLEEIASYSPGVSIPTIQDIAAYNVYGVEPSINNTSNNMTTNSVMDNTMQTSTSTQNNSSGNDLQALTYSNQPAALSSESLQYMNGFLRTQVGRLIRVEFLIGTSTMVERTGILVGVGANYILINEIETDDLLICDFYNIKFIRFYY